MNGSNKPEGVVNIGNPAACNLVIDDGPMNKGNNAVSSGTNIVVEDNVNNNNNNSNSNNGADAILGTNVVNDSSLALPPYVNEMRKGYALAPGCQYAGVKKEHNKRVGRAIVKKNGTKIASLFYGDDLLNGMCSFYNDGGKLKEKVFFENDIAQGWSGVCKDGAVDYLVYYDKGYITKKLTKVNNQWKEESIKNELLYDGDYSITAISLKGDDFHFYRKGNGNSYRNGNMYYVGSWDNDVPHGNGNLYDPVSGDLLFSGLWEKGVLRKPDGTVFDYMKDEPHSPQPSQPSQPSQPGPQPGPQPSYPSPQPGPQLGQSGQPSPQPGQPGQLGQLGQPSPQPDSKRKNPFAKLNKPGAGKKQLIILISIIAVALILIIGCICWCSWYIKGVDYTICTPEEYKKIDFRMRSLTIPSNCLNDFDFTLLELKGYDRLTYITIGDKSMRYGEGFRVIDCPKLKVITVGKESFNNVVNWDKTSFSYDISRSVIIKNCPELTKITVGLGTFVAFDIFDITSIFR